jgi:hypothetical protein
MTELGSPTLAAAAWMAAVSLALGMAGIAFGLDSRRRARHARGELKALERSVAEFRSVLLARLQQERDRCSALLKR